MQFTKEDKYLCNCIQLTCVRKDYAHIVFCIKLDLTCPDVQYLFLHKLLGCKINFIFAQYTVYYHILFLFYYLKLFPMLQHLFQCFFFLFVLQLVQFPVHVKIQSVVCQICHQLSTQRAHHCLSIICSQLFLSCSEKNVSGNYTFDELEFVENKYEGQSSLCSKVTSVVNSQTDFDPLRSRKAAFFFMHQ